MPRHSRLRSRRAALGADPVQDAARREIGLGQRADPEAAGAVAAPIVEAQARLVLRRSRQQLRLLGAEEKHAALERHQHAAFAAKRLKPNVVLTALDSDVIKTYVELGMGAGIVAQMAYDPGKDQAFEMIDASHLFATSTTRLALRRGVFLRGYIYQFIALFAPQYSREAVDAALDGDATPVEL